MSTKLLLLHGALGTKNQFAKLKSSLENQFEVFVLDFAGHGQNISSTDFSIDLFTENVLEFLIKNNIDAIDVFGYSMGGYVALNTALKYPERIKTIITLGTKFDWSLESAEKEVKMLDVSKIEQKVPQFAEKLKTDHAPQDWRSIVERTASMMLNLAKGDKLTFADISKIKSSVVVGLGSMDNMVSVEESLFLSKNLQDAHLQILENVHHPVEKVDVHVLDEYIRSALLLRKAV